MEALKDFDTNLQEYVTKMVYLQKLACKILSVIKNVACQSGAAPLNPHNHTILKAFSFGFFQKGISIILITIVRKANKEVVKIRDDFF